MNRLIPKVLHTILKYHMLKAGDAVVAGVSGGADSVALLHILLSFQEMGLQVTAAHVNHNLRGDESSRDEAFVKALCERLHIECAVDSPDVGGLSEKKGISLEEAGREARYTFFERLAAKKHAKIAVAHNLNDSLETVLLNLTRGSALRGLCGIPPVRGNIIRPLIACPRAEIERYLQENHIGFVTDSTNLSLNFTRNRIRHSVIPQLLAVNPGLLGTVSANLEALRADADYLDAAARDALTAMRLPDGRLDRKKYLASECSLRFRILRLFEGYGVSACNKRLSRLDALARAGSGMEQLSGNLFFGADEKTLYLWQPDEKTEPFRVPLDLPLQKGETEIDVFSDKKLRLLNTDYEYYEENIKCDQKLLKNAIDCDRINNAAMIRQRQAGDVIRLVGRGCTKTLKNLFQESGIPASKRGNILILADAAGPFWIEGFGVAEHAAVTPETSSVLVPYVCFAKCDK